MIQKKHGKTSPSQKMKRGDVPAILTVTSTGQQASGGKRHEGTHQWG